MKTRTEYHYVYKITNTKPTDSRKYYIGVRSSTVKPIEDIKYMGSSKHLKKSILEETETYFKKEIIDDSFETRELAERAERELLISIDAKNNQEYYNRHNATEIGFSQKDRVMVIDVKLNIICSVSKTEFENNEHLISIFKNSVTVKLKNNTNTKYKRISLNEYYKNRKMYEHVTENKVFAINKKTGKTETLTKEEFSKNRVNYIFSTDGEVTVVDKRDNSIKNISQEDFKKYDYYVSINNGKVNVIDKRNGLSKQVTKEEYYNSEYYQSLQYNLVAVIDTRDGVSKKVTREEYHNNDFYIHHANKIIDIFDSNGKIVYTSYANFKDFCENHNLSYQILCISYKNDGKPIFQNISDISYNRLKRKNRLFQIGWYAKIRK